jgi:nucleoside-diphosphate-sugar epimerase
LYESGIEFTVLQPTMFMQNLDNNWSAVLKQGRFSLPYSKHMKASYVDYRDVAEVAALALTEDKLGYGTFELCAPGMVNRLELVAMMSEAIGQSIEAGEPTFDEWAQAAHIPNGSTREGMRKMYANTINMGFLAVMRLCCEPFSDGNPAHCGNIFRSWRVKNRLRDCGG